MKTTRLAFLISLFYGGASYAGTWDDPESINKTTCLFSKNIKDSDIPLITENPWPNLTDLVFDSPINWEKILSEGQFPALTGISFVEKVTISQEQAKAFGEILINKHPNIKYLNFQGTGVDAHHLEEMMGCLYQLKNLEQLEIQGEKLNLKCIDHVKKLSQSPHFTHLSFCDIKVFSTLGSPIQTFMNEAQGWPYLKELDLSGNAIDVQGLQFLVKKDWPELENLILKKNLIRNQGWTLFNSYLFNFKNLTTLDLSGNFLGSSGLSLPVHCPKLPDQDLTKLFPKLPRLENLYLSCNEISDKWLTKMIRSIKFSSIRCLDLQNNKVGLNGVKSLAVSRKKIKHFDKLESLNLGNNDLDEQAIEVFCHAKWPSMKDLNVAHNPIGNNGLYFLMNSSHKLSALESLNLSKVKIDHEGMRSIVKASGRLCALRNLILPQNKIGTRGVNYFVKHAEFTELNELDLSYNKIRNVSLLCKRPQCLDNLSFCNLYGNNQIPHEGMMNLIETFESRPVKLKLPAKPMPSSCDPHKKYWGGEVKLDFD